MSPYIACRDCKFFGDDEGQSCFRPEMMIPHVIYGEVTSFPKTNREDGHRCGIGARYFVPRVVGWRLFRGL